MRSQIVNLGPDIDPSALVLTLYLSTGGARSEVADSSGIEVAAIGGSGSGDVQFSNLPDGSATLRYALKIATAGSPAIELYSLTWGGSPAGASRSRVTNIAPDITSPFLLSLYKSVNGGAFTDQDSSGISTDAVGTTGSGDYEFSNLPIGSQVERFYLKIAATGSPGLALADFSWGGVSDFSVVWRNAQLPVFGWPPIKAGDTYGELALPIPSGLPASILSSESVAFFSLRKADPLVTPPDDDPNWPLLNRPASIRAPFLDGGTGTYGATLVYSLTDGAVPRPGTFLPEWRLELAGGFTRRWPILTPNLVVEPAIAP